MRTQNIALDGTYTINHNYGSLEIRGLDNALNVFFALWTHYHTEDDVLRDYSRDRVRRALEIKGMYEDECGYLDIHV